MLRHRVVVGLAGLMAASVLVMAQVILTVLAPGDQLEASCTGEWASLTQTPTMITADCVEPPPPPPPITTLVIDHTSVALFDQVPLADAQALRVLSVDKSVGWNIHHALTACLGVDAASSPNGCRRWAWQDGQYPSPPMTWTAHPLPGWQYYTWPGQSSPDGTPSLPCPDVSSDLACFESYLAAHATEWDVVSWQSSYLEAGSGLSAETYLASYERVKALYSSLTIMLHTASLPKCPGAGLTAFNVAIRDYWQANGGVLLDIADIETFDPYGSAWSAGADPAIAPHYNSETCGGHLGYPSSGKLRLAQAWWVALAQIAGWRP